jgi:hypothetical protein
MPVLARPAGEWEGTYTYVDRDGKVVDQHRAQLSCLFPSEGEWPYRQTNRYTWADGRKEVHEFPAAYHDGRIWFDTERIQGSAWETDDSTVILTWQYKDNPDEYLYEMIQLDGTGTKRSRVWQWFRDGDCYQRTIINEQKIS